MNYHDMSTERKAELFEREMKHANALTAAPYQIFRINESGRWIPVLDKQCAPSPDCDDPFTYMAIIDGAPHPVTVKSAGRSFIPFVGGDDGETEYSFDLIANGIQVGSCSYREY